MKAYVIDNEGKFIEKAQSGELFITGSQIALGYYLNDLENKNSFIEVNINNNIMRGYRTGDYVTILNDGRIRYNGRKDRQYKINGVRIELGEVEHAINQILSDYKQIYSCVRNNSIYVWLVTDYSFDEDKIRENLKQFLPDIMIPKRIIRLESLPLNGNGKVDENDLFNALTHSTFSNENKDYLIMREYLLDL